MIEDEFVILSPEISLDSEAAHNSVGVLAAELGIRRKPPRGTDGQRLDAVLPSDYRRIVEEFPAGWFQGFAGLHYPGVPLAWRHFDLDARQDEARGLLRDLRERGHDLPFAVHPEPGGLLAWGSSRWGNSFFWTTEDRDPEMWRVVVSAPLFAHWEVFDGGVADFLLALVRGSFWPDFFTSDVDLSSPWWEPVPVDIWADSPSEVRLVEEPPTAGC